MAGASGGPGRALVDELRREHDVVALTPGRAGDDAVAFRTCDLFNLREAERALRGIDVAFYVAGAMASSSRLSQGSKEDLELLYADNFARAAQTNGVREIVYVSGAIPRSEEVERALASHGVPVRTRHVESSAAEPPQLETVARARSVQRLPLPRGRDADWIAAEYVRWLPRFMRPVLRIDVDASRTCRFYLRPLPGPLLVLTYAPERSGPDRQLFFVTGGMLSHRANVEDRARLEFRSMLGGSFVLAALHDFAPSLPWLVYELTQARVHLLVMERFAEHLATR